MSTTVLTQDRFAETTGLTPDTVRGMVARGQLPTVKIGRHRLVNVAALCAELLAAEHPGEAGGPHSLTVVPSPNMALVGGAR
jgi:excisionase family DNA binding protein